MKITKLKNKIKVHWDSDIHKFINKKINLYNILFSEVRCRSNIGFVINIPSLMSSDDWFSDDHDDDIMWVSDQLFYNNTYRNFLYDSYEIFGVYFTNEEEAMLFAKILEKNYIWHQLKN